MKRASPPSNGSHASLDRVLLSQEKRAQLQFAEVDSSEGEPVRYEDDTDDEDDHHDQPNTQIADPQEIVRWRSKSNKLFNSLDFDQIENQLVIESRRKDPHGHEPSQGKVWLIIVVIAVLTAAVAFGIDMGIKGLMYLKFQAVEHFMNTTSRPVYANVTVTVNGTETTIEDVSWETDAIPFAVPFILYIVINLAYVSIAAGLVIFGEPVARGSGIGEIKCYLNGIRIFRVVRFNTLVCKAVGILFSVASGLPCGKEGPMIHSGAAIASGVATGTSTKLHCDTGLFREFRDDKQKRQFVTAGAAAGVGAAFGAPVGGLLFAVEEVGSFWSLDLTVKVFVCSAVTPWVLQFFLSPTEYKNTQVTGLIDFGQVEGAYTYSDIPFVLLLGILGGLIGAGFIAMNIQLTKWRRKYVHTRARRFIEVLVINALTSIVMISLVLRGYTCNDASVVLQTNRGELRRYGCPPGQYNDMATYFFRSMEDSIHVLIHTEREIPFLTLVMQMVPLYFLMILTYGIYVPSGLFLPNLALGASFGHLYAQTWNSILGHNTLSPARFAVYGGTAVLGGCVRMTISVVAIIMEATGNTGLFYPLVIITLAAKVVGDKFTQSVYVAHLDLNNIPLLGNELSDPKTATLAANNVMDQELVLVPVRIRVAHLKKVLRVFPYNNALIVIDPESGHFRGLLLRRSAVILIAKGAWERRLDLQDFVKNDREREYLRVKKYRILEHDARSDAESIDLTPYMDQWPHTVQETTPLPRVFRTFRELGLRHIIVLDENRRPVGVIGRKQLVYLQPIKDNEELIEDVPGPNEPRESFLLSPCSPTGSPSTFPGAMSNSRLLSPMRQVMTNQQLVSSFEMKLHAGDDDHWFDSHIHNVS